MITDQRSSDASDIEDLPEYTHTQVLGVDIGVPQRDYHKGDFRRDVDIYVYRGEKYRSGSSRIFRDLAHHARRNLFEGVNSRD